MKFTELLKTQGLTDEQILAITGAMTKEKIYTTTEQNIEERYHKLKGQKEDLEQQLNTATATINDLKKANKDNEALQTKVKEYETELQTLKTESEAKIRNITLDNAISKLLGDNKAKYADLLAGKFDRDKLEIKEDGSIIGLEDQFKTIKESYKDMFEQSITGRTPNNSSNTNPTEVDVSKMTYSEMMDYMSKNPDAQI